MTSAIAIHGLTARSSDLARGIVVVRSRRELSGAEQKAIIAAMAAANMTELPDDDRPDNGPRRLLAAPWAPPLATELDAHRATIEELSSRFELETAWFYKVETSIDGVAWVEWLREMRAADDGDESYEDDDEDEIDDDDIGFAPDDGEDPPSDDEGDEDEDDDDDEAKQFHGAQVVYSAPDAPGGIDAALMDAALGEAASADADDEDEDEDEDDTSADDEDAALKSFLGPKAMDFKTIQTEEELAAFAAEQAGDGDDDDGDDDDDDGNDDDGDDDEFGGAQSWLEVGGTESHWRNGPPPMEQSVEFSLERYPEIIDQYDWADFGIAIKLAGEPISGEDSIINAFFALWLSVYQDERVEDFEPFGEADVMHDRVRRSALLWVDRFTVPATPADQVHFLLWIVAQLGEIVPIAWARFDQDDLAAKFQADETSTQVVLAGNPLAERYRSMGESAAIAWASAQSLWDPREIAAMIIEIALQQDPTDENEAAVAERLLLRATELDPTSEATGLLCTVWIRQGRFEEALARTRSPRHGDRANPGDSDDDGADDAMKAGLRMHLLGETVSHAPTFAARALAEVDEATIARVDDSNLGDLTISIAEHTPDLLEAFLAKLPLRTSIAPHLYNASFSRPREQSLLILSRVLVGPEPTAEDDAPRRAYVMAWNNACIHAHALGLVDRACELADGALRFAPENPYIFHSAACAYAAAGKIDRALAEIRGAIEYGYEHIEKMETDTDLGKLLDEPAFKALFVDWRAQRADLN